jgi:FixJ family two-component response regulator
MNCDFVDSLVVDVPSESGMSEVPLIAIVDDDALARDGIRELVDSLGYKAITFESAQHFLASPQHPRLRNHTEAAMSGSDYRRNLPLFVI